MHETCLTIPCPISRRVPCGGTPPLIALTLSRRLERARIVAPGVQLLLVPILRQQCKPFLARWLVKLWVCLPKSGGGLQDTVRILRIRLEYSILRNTHRIHQDTLRIQFHRKNPFFIENPPAGPGSWWPRCTAAPRARRGRAPLVRHGRARVSARCAPR